MDFVEISTGVNPGELLDVAAISAEPDSWLMLARSGHLSKFEARSESLIDIGKLDLPVDPADESYKGHQPQARLHVSRRGDFVAVVNDYGRLGLVLNTRAGRVTLELHGGDYLHRTVPFSFAFVEQGQRTLAVHRTDWNRLDVSDAQTGESLTSRAPTSYEEGEERPEHYLDYFHGRLLVSPDSRRIADDGWVWHPVGIPTVWSIDAWLGRNVWESDDGPSKVNVCGRESYWDHGMCWIDSSHLALEGIGDDGQEMIDGVRVFDVDRLVSSTTYTFMEAQEVARLIGPKGMLFSDGERLFSCDRSSGLAILDISSGKRTNEARGFCPTRQHVASRQLVEIVDSNLRSWTY